MFVKCSVFLITGSRVNLKTKRELVEKALHLQRFTEERVQLVTEMKAYIAYYRNHLQRLMEYRDQIRSAIDASEGSTFSFGIGAAGTYALLNHNDTNVLKGMLSSTKQQISLMDKQICEARTCFRQVLSDAAAGHEFEFFSDSDDYDDCDDDDTSDTSVDNDNDVGKDVDCTDDESVDVDVDNEDDF